MRDRGIERGKESIRAAGKLGEMKESYSFSFYEEFSVP